MRPARPRPWRKRITRRSAGPWPTDSVADLLEQGRFTHALLREQGWIKRRVESVDLTGSDTIRRRVTFDLDMKLLRKYAADAGLPTEAAGTDAPVVYVPLAVLPKTLYLDLDVRDSRDNAVPLLTSDEDSRAAVGAVVAAAEIAGFNPGFVSDALVEHLFNIARAMPSDADIARMQSAVAAEPDAWHFSPEGPGDAQVHLWQQLMDNDDVADVVRDLTTRFMATIEVPLQGSTAVYKLAYTENLRTARRSFRKKLDGVWQAGIEAPAIGTAGREHFRVSAPTGLTFSQVSLVKIDSPLLPGNTRTADSSFHYRQRLAPDRAHIYTHGLPVGNYLVAITMQPPRAGFIRQGRALLFASALLLAAGALVEWLSRRLDTSAREAAVVLLLVIPSLLLAMLAREGEHQLVSEVLRTPRGILGTGAAINVLAGAFLALGYGQLVLEISWTAAAVIVFACFGLLDRPYRRAEAAERVVVSNSDRVRERRLQEQVSV